MNKLKLAKTLNMNWRRKQRELKGKKGFERKRIGSDLKAYLSGFGAI
eukprot:CAMPEP_0197008640 /NCGR_PEP_ID=MMETSP1380-20130617/46202_1 /TAXON_ID=5936 /ORGANISM="Euplotes crassus, Strain CT5" /LENGTH=46 /DNA_ID= /DNA_START= /DNA_END= /DNA_ORIENTATION=